MSYITLISCVQIHAIEGTGELPIGCFRVHNKNGADFKLRIA
jgi:hypothetical protein